MQILLENEEIRLTINTFGAEMASIYHKKKETEYLWCADAAYWKRSAPVLFPFVGSLQDKTFRYEGKTYPMGQHGFARDMEFEVESQTADQVWFVLRSNEQTLEKYPLAYVLHVGQGVYWRMRLKRTSPGSNVSATYSRIRFVSSTCPGRIRWRMRTPLCKMPSAPIT